ncbi:MAG: EAL domain-containing protein [Thiotrichaceae bacterium]|nr:EAL domain-containing protein [Thiotrichaceae bacterium]
MIDIDKSTPQLLKENHQLRRDLAGAQRAADKTSAELNKQEERAILALRGANDGLWDWDLEADYVHFSPRWKSMLGYAETELENEFSTWEHLIHPADKDLVSLVKRVIDETGMVPSELELEVTEGVVQTDSQNLSVFQDLKDLGVLLAIDDFGTGYLSFASLKHLKVDCLKIDKYFVDDMMNDEKTLLLISSMVEMGHNLGHDIIAEGVETPEQFDILKQINCETVQGYLFSKPVSANEITRLLALPKLAVNQGI